MTRKDYVLIAAALKSARPSDDGCNATAIRAHHSDQIARRLGDALAADNAAFDRPRFLKACGVAV